jgi:hypothetical protein
MATPTAPQIIDDVRNEAAGWLDQLVLYWDRLFATEKSLCLAIITANGGGGGGASVVEHDGYATITDGATVVNVPTVDIE